MNPGSIRARRGLKLAVGSGVVLATLAGLMVWAMARPNSTYFYLTTSELAARGPAAAAHDYRVNGKVVAGSIHKDGVRTTFGITDGKTPVTVTTSAALPDTFKAGANVVAQGTYDGRTFKADQVLAKCPSKFKPKAG